MYLLSCYVMSCKWPLTINFTDMSIHILSLSLSFVIVYNTVLIVFDVNVYFGCLS